MHYLALYRKYRPNNFDDVVGQDKVIDVIRNEILNNKISHAYLFSGPRGTGKTTTAKIIAKLVNCKNLVDGVACEKCDSCLNFKNSNDIVEIDAASNNGVDEIRELRDKINLVPSIGKYKVYIIDEVHMLTTQAFNALLKTLEEPPAHAIFILATTELYKIPLTVASRCQKFQFSKISNNEIVNRLKKIIECENISLSEDILYEISRLSDGGLRDAINMLDQLISYKSDNITTEDVYKINGTVSYNDMYNFIVCMKENNAADIINFIEKIDNEGKNISKFTEEFIVFLKDILLYRNAGIECDIAEKREKIRDLSSFLDDKVIYNIIYAYNDTLNDMKLSSTPLILFVVSSLKIIKDNFDVITDDGKHNNSLVNNSCINVKKEIVSLNNEDGISNEIIANRINNTFALANKNDLNKIKDKWPIINEYLLDDKYGVNSGILKDTNVVAAGGEYLILTSSYDSIVEKVNTRSLSLEDTIEHIFGVKYYIVCLTNEMWNDEKNKYLINFKNGKKYNLIEEKKENKEKTPVDELIDIIGDDLIEIV